MPAKLTAILGEGFQRGGPHGEVSNVFAEGFQVASDLGCITALFVEVFQFGIPEPEGGPPRTVSAGIPRSNSTDDDTFVVSAGQPTSWSTEDA